MGHPSDDEAWKVLDNFDANIASDARNARIRLVTYDFSPFSTNAAPYSYWLQPTTFSLHEEEFNKKKSCQDSFIIESGPGLDDLIGDADDIQTP
jgi:hypothetical protein